MGFKDAVETLLRPPSDSPTVARTAATSRARAEDEGVDEELIRKVAIPYKIIRSYCRVTIEGLENIPSGRAVLAANHTGWLGLDYANLAISIHDALGRVPRGVVHPLWFSGKKVADVARRLGLVPAEKPLIVRLLRREKLVVIFPEAEQGAFKTTTEVQYQLEEFKRGFVRVAMEAKAPIVPVAVVGGEEAHPVLGQLSLTDKLFRLPLPRPTNILPRPVKWRISILPPIPMDGWSAADAADRETVHRLAAKVKRQIHKELRVQLRKRGNKYL